MPYDYICDEVLLLRGERASNIDGTRHGDGSI